MRHRSCLLLLALSSVGCGSAPREVLGGEGGDGAAILPPIQKPLTWNQYGTIDGRYGIEGVWRSYADYESPSPGLRLTEPDPLLVGPDGRPGWSASSTQICLKGVAPQVVRDADKKLAFDRQWGAGLRLDLNNGQAYDARARGITGFMCDIASGSTGAASPPTLRVQFAAVLEAGGADHFINIALPAADQALSFSDAEQGAWVVDPKPLTADAMLAIMFQVYTNPQAPKSYDFCISNFRVLM